MRSFPLTFCSSVDNYENNLGLVIPVRFVSINRSSIVIIIIITNQFTSQHSQFIFLRHTNTDYVLVARLSANPPKEYKISPDLNNTTEKRLCKLKIKIGRKLFQEFNLFYFSSLIKANAIRITNSCASWTAQLEVEFPARGRGSGHFRTLIRKCLRSPIPRLIQAVNQSTLTRSGHFRTLIWKCPMQ